MNSDAAIKITQQLANHDDRFAMFSAFIALIIAMAFALIMVCRFFIAERKELVNSLKESHHAYTNKLEEIVAERTSLIVAHTAATVAQEKTCRATGDVMREVAEELAIRRRERNGT
jgi:hypothetical protein